MELSTQIKEARRKLALTQKQAAQLWDVPLKTLRHWEQGRHSPRGFALKMLQQVLNTSLSADQVASDASEPPGSPDTDSVVSVPLRKTKRAKRLG